MSLCFTTTHTIEPKQTQPTPDLPISSRTREKRRRAGEDMRERLTKVKPVIYLDNLTFSKPEVDEYKGIIDIYDSTYDECKGSIRLEDKTYAMLRIGTRLYCHPTNPYWFVNSRQALLFNTDDYVVSLGIRPTKRDDYFCYDRVIFDSQITVRDKRSGIEIDIDYDLVTPNVIKKINKLCLRQRRKTLQKTIYNIGFCRDVAGIISNYVM